MITCLIVGRQNHGKTTLIEELVAELTRRGLRVATIKHSCHSHPIDSPGKDSFRHRAAGAAACALVTRDEIAVFMPNPGQERFRAALAPFFEGYDALLIEGNPDWAGPKLEVYRAGLGTSPMCLERRDITAVVSDDPLEVPVPVWPRSDLAGLAERLLALATGRGAP